MEDELIKKGGKGGMNFFQHVFNLNDDSKADIFNIMQYAVLAIIPVVLLNKSIARFLPDVDEEKGNIEILFEIVIQIILMFLGILIIHRIITFIPTYSGQKYADFDITNIILAMLIIILGFSTKLGEKTNILVERIYNFWNGTDNNSKQKKGKGNGNATEIKTIQPIAQQSAMMFPSTMLASSSGSTSISDLPIHTGCSSGGSSGTPINYDAMYRQDNNPLVGAAIPGMEGFDLAPANSVIGSSFGGI